MTEETKTTDIAKWVANQSHSNRNIIAVITRNTLCEGDERFNAVVKQLIEALPTYIGEFPNGFTVDDWRLLTPDQRLEPTVSPKEAIRTSGRNLLTFEYFERYGRSVERGYEALAEATAKTAAGRSEDDQRGLDVMFIEPDVTFKAAVRAWHWRNMEVLTFHSPNSNRNITARRSKRIKVRAFWQCHEVSRTEEDRQQATDILKRIDVMSANPRSRLRDVLPGAWSGINSEN